MKGKKGFQVQPDFNEVMESGIEGSSFLTLFNDNIHSFEYVIESLVDVCEHDIEQAEQCTYLVHYKGKCEVKKGNFKSLVPLKKELSRRGLSATIN